MLTSPTSIHTINIRSAAVYRASSTKNTPLNRSSLHTVQSPHSRAANAPDLERLRGAHKLEDGKQLLWGIFFARTNFFYKPASARPHGQIRSFQSGCTECALGPLFSERPV